MPVEVHQTPNPNARKFILPGRQFAAPLNASRPEEAAAHPLAQALFALDGVYNVFLAQDFVTVNKLPALAWDEVEPRVQAAIVHYLASDPGATEPFSR
jgi:hypothetical protein